jgi:HK97 gp10 family phage protein
MTDGALTITGGRGIAQTLAKLPKRTTERKVARAALKAATKPTVRAMRRGAPVDEGDLKKDINSRTVTKSRHPIHIAVGTSPKAPHGHLIELGTDERFTESGARRGKVAPKPFASRAFDETKNKVVANLGRETSKRLSREALKLARQNRAKR